ncbi:hypothetical protein BpHYR1_032927 [Brachionus plicatilis]|uniref:Uncharacterized protein n=1 Tax=Brachionus plicatilis TaxID=10195 RepID=A0A3M7SWE2_BRAPC|nr:hypothetical protein BpHYR1_032927 [Brachionus plicatilis]
MCSHLIAIGYLQESNDFINKPKREVDPNRKGHFLTSKELINSAIESYRILADAIDKLTLESLYKSKYLAS